MKTFFTLLILAFSVSAFSQTLHRCATDEAISLRESETPGYKEAINRTFAQAKELTENRASTPDPIYQIPVVVHIVYNSAEENISDAMVHSQIARLNRDYRRLNADTTDTRNEFLPVAADAGIEFYLAGTDPDGSATTGIKRTETTRADFAVDPFGAAGAMDEVKQSSFGGADAWDTEHYLNIWVCDLFGSSPLFQVLGYAFPPATAPNWPANSGAASSEFEGVVIHYEVFGDNNPLATGDLSIADKGRTPVHEIGHFLGLRHIWGDAIVFLGEDGCAVDDGLDDTPNAAESAGQICDFNNNSCVDSPVDFPDMIENYMDYAREECMNLFTQGQVDIMRSMLETARSGLIEGQIQPSGITDAINESEVGVFPNPTNGQFEVQIPKHLALLSVCLFDVAGKEMNISIENLGTNLSVNSNMPAGLYMLQLQFEEGTVTKRINVY